jgi:hypothetical protein
MSIQNFNELESPTRVHHPTKESYVVSAEEAKELFKQGWYPRRKFAKEAAKGKPEVAAKKTNEKKSIEAPVNRRKELEKMKFFALRSLHKKVVGKDERKMKTPQLIDAILKQEAV